MTRLRSRFKAGNLALLVGASVLNGSSIEPAKRFAGLDGPKQSRWQHHLARLGEAKVRRKLHVIAAVCASTLSLFACSRQASALASASHAAWTVANPAGTLDLLGVQLTPSSEGWAVGDIDPRGTGGAVFRTADAGRTWTPVAARSEVFTSVHFITPLVGWIAGYAGRIDRTDDGGRSWRSQRREAGREILNAVWAVDDRHVWAVGASGLIVRTIDGGNTWALVPPPVRTDLWAVKFVSPLRGWIAGDSGVVLATRDGGSTWSVHRTPTKRALYGLVVAPPGTAVAVGDSGAIVRTDDGERWTEVDAGTSASLNAVAAADGTTFVAVGTHGAVLASSDAGRSWTSQPSLAPVKLTAVAMADARRGVAVGARGFVQVMQ
jgi:photosystem II stability/assembly factor-like uncharacterized protein